MSHFALQTERQAAVFRLIEEVSQPQTPASYWDHVRREMEEMEKRWLQVAKSVAATNTGSAEASSPEML